MEGHAGERPPDVDTDPSHWSAICDGRLHRGRASSKLSAHGRQRLVDEVERLFWRAARCNRRVLSIAQRFREPVGRYHGFVAACQAHDGERAEEESIRWTFARAVDSIPSEAEGA